MHNIRTNFTKILEVIKGLISDEVPEEGNLLKNGAPAQDCS
jgi:hypothetical protein